MRSTRSSLRISVASARPSSPPIWTSWLKFLLLSSLMFIGGFVLPAQSGWPDRKHADSVDRTEMKPACHAPHVTGPAADRVGEAGVPRYYHAPSGGQAARGPMTISVGRARHERSAGTQGASCAGRTCTLR